MPDPAQFGHDELGHLLHSLLRVPRFQRRYSWKAEHVDEFWDDIERARAAGDSYFLGTIVLAEDSEDESRRLIVDGQQRITTTALLLIAIRDRLEEFGRDLPAQSVEREHLSDYILSEEKTVPRLTLNSDDHATYDLLLERIEVDDKHDPIASAYKQLRAHINGLAPSDDDYRRLIDLTSYLDTQLQVLLAVATGLPEAYVIFETLNDRGADLTTADLLKNFLFSQAGDAIGHVGAAWTRISGQFDDPDDFVRFLRYEYMSRKGRVTNRALYKALQADIGSTRGAVRNYLARLEDCLQRYTALREPDDVTWSSQAVEVKDSLLAFRRFGFDSSMPLLLAAFATWSHTNATRFVDAVAAWSVRSWTAGTLGGGVAERAFCDAAVAVTQKRAISDDDVRTYMLDLVPADAEFAQAFANSGSVTTTRAKYLLARLERQYLTDLGKNVESMPDWSSKSVSVEHIFAKSSRRSAFATDEDFDRFSLMRDRLQNLTLLERSLNAAVEDKPFQHKAPVYKRSAFALTQELAGHSEWTFSQVDLRAQQLAELAVKAWPM